jgi:hypothetical protein
MNNKWQLIVTLIGVLWVAPAGLAADNPPESPTKMQDIRKLMALTGSEQLGQQVLDGMFQQLKQALPNVPDKFWQQLRQQININEMLDQMAPIHDKYLTHEEVKELIKFYETPLGRKLVSVTPKISEESTLAGQKWVMGVGQTIEKKLEAEGYK